MLQSFHIVFRKESTNEEESADFGSFAIADWEDLLLFRDSASEIGDSDLVKNWKKNTVTINWEKGVGISVPTESPSVEEVRLFLHLFRPVYLKREPANFNKICNKLRRHFNHALFRDFIRIRKGEYSSKLIRQGIPIKVGQWIINSDEFLDHYLNAHEYHRDRDKRTDIENISRVFPSEAQWALLCQNLICKGYATKAIGRFINTLEERQDGSRIRLIRP
jgi:hypothetical protein